MTLPSSEPDVLAGLLEGFDPAEPRGAHGRWRRLLGFKPESTLKGHSGEMSQLAARLDLLPQGMKYHVFGAGRAPAAGGVGSLAHVQRVRSGFEVHHAGGVASHSTASGAAAHVVRLVGTASRRVRESGPAPAVLGALLEHRAG